MNETIKTLLGRRSVREYTSKEVSREDLELIAKAGSYAPSAGGHQSGTIIVLTKKDDIEAIRKINAEIMGKSEANPYYGATAIMLVLADKSSNNGVYDGALICGNIMNAAASLGIGSCWIHRIKETFEREDGKALLKKWNISGDFVGVGSVALGYTNQKVIGEGAARKDKFVNFV